MDQNRQNYEDVEIDLGRYVRLMFKRKITFFAVLLLTLVIGFPNILSSPKKMYRSLIMFQPPVIGPSLTGADDFESAENIKGLIVNNVFHEQLSKKMNLRSDQTLGAFMVNIPKGTNILQVSIDLGSEDKESGVVLLRNLKDVMFEIYAKRIGAKVIDINNQIKANERAITNYKEKIINLQEQTKEVLVRKDKLMDEIKLVSLNSAQISEKRGELTTSKAISELTENASVLLLSNFLQNNFSYLNQLNNQFSGLTIRELNLRMELKNIVDKISNLEMEIDKLKIKGSFITNLKTISEPRTSLKPRNSGRKKVVVMLIAMGLFFGLLAVFLQEFWVNNLVKK